MPLKGILSNSNRFYLYNILLYSSIDSNPLESVKITLDINRYLIPSWRGPAAIIRAYVLQTHTLEIAHQLQNLPHFENLLHLKTYCTSIAPRKLSL